jgi:hypothetical protein
MSRTYRYIVIAVGAVCLYFLVRLLFFTDLTTRNVPSDVFQGILVGAGLALVTAQLYGRTKVKKINGWTTAIGAGASDSGMFLRAANSWAFPGPIAVAEEATYWRTGSDGAGHTLNGSHRYVLHFPPGQLPPTDAFWSLTMGDGQNRYVPNPLDRYHVGNHSGLVPNTDGSVDIYLQSNAPLAHEANWLPAPAGDFILWLRVYIPGAAILDGTYALPPVTKVDGS